VEQSSGTCDIPENCTVTHETHLLLNPPHAQARRDGQCARTQLQLAVKQGLGTVEQYFHFKTQVRWFLYGWSPRVVTTTNTDMHAATTTTTNNTDMHAATTTNNTTTTTAQDLSKKLKDESGGLDLMGYIELQRWGVMGVQSRRTAHSELKASLCLDTPAALHSSKPTHNQPSLNPLAPPKKKNAATPTTTTTRNYRACVRAHQMALAAQRALWTTLLHDTLSFSALRESFDVMQKAEAQAYQVYRRWVGLGGFGKLGWGWGWGWGLGFGLLCCICGPEHFRVQSLTTFTHHLNPLPHNCAPSVLERYPNNGRLLKIYGRFLEWVRNEPSKAQKYYEVRSTADVAIGLNWIGLDDELVLLPLHAFSPLCYRKQTSARSPRPLQPNHHPTNCTHNPNTKRPAWLITRRRQPRLGCRTACWM